MIPLSAIATVRMTNGPKAVERLDMYSMFEISGNPAPGVALKDARAICERIAKEELGQGFRLVWLSDIS
jgi:multidrug efflux pump subunit AcrB